MRNFLLHRRRRWIARAFGRNPLLRWTDRVEACTVLAAILLALALSPVCVAQAADVYRSHAQLYAAQSRTRHMVTASVVATGDPPYLPHTTTSAVLAVWSNGADGARGGSLRPGMPSGSQRIVRLLTVIRSTSGSTTPVRRSTRRHHRLAPVSTPSASARASGVP
jgi:hypothetical protein